MVSIVIIMSTVVCCNYDENDIRIVGLYVYSAMVSTSSTTSTCQYHLQTVATFHFPIKAVDKLYINTIKKRVLK